MFNRVVFGRIGRIMRDANLEAQFIREELEISLEEIMPCVVTTAAITQQQEPPTVGIASAPMLMPPAAQALDRQFARVVTGAELKVADVETHSVQTMRDNDAFVETGEIGVIGSQFFQGVQFTRPIKVAEMFSSSNPCSESGRPPRHSRPAAAESSQIARYAAAPRAS